MQELRRLERNSLFHFNFNIRIMSLFELLNLITCASVQYATSNSRLFDILNQSNCSYYEWMCNEINFKVQLSKYN